MRDIQIVRLLKPRPSAFVSALCRWFFAHKLAGSVVLIVLGASIFAKAILVGFAGAFLREDPLAKSDAIVILLGGAYDRTERAAELYRQGIAPIILLGPTEKFSDEADMQRMILGFRGVPLEAIRTISGMKVKSTYDEAIRVRDHIQSHPLKRIVLVTTKYHTARASWIFRRVLGGSEVVVLTASSRQTIDETNWYTSVEGIKIYITELFKTIYYHALYYNSDKYFVFQSVQVPHGQLGRPYP